MTITLVTGANKGIGFETTRRLIAEGHTVYLGARDPGRGQAAAEQLGAHWLPLDVTNDASVEAAAKQVEQDHGHLDVLVNNAGIATSGPLGDVTADAIRSIYEVNVFGVVRVTHAFLPLLERSAHPVIVNVSSSLGSISLALDPDSFESAWNGLEYPSSKAALNMLTAQYAKAYPGFRINVVNPGFTATDLNGHRGTQTVKQGAEIIVRMATVRPDGPTATFADEAGPLPW
jgi:NAD(P)-dependent dehydrogenase (short-subunit alcohol dehydrogenase family)